MLNLLKYKEKTKKVKKMKKDVDNVEDICYIINALEKNEMQNEKVLWKLSKMSIWVARKINYE